MAIEQLGTDEELQYIKWYLWIRHAADIAKSEGLFWGLVDGDGKPVMDLPPVIDYTAPLGRNRVESCEVTVATLVGGVTHPIVGALISDQLMDTQPSGRLQPSLRGLFFLVFIKDGVKTCYRVTHCEVKGDAQGPLRMTIHGVTLLDMLNDIPFWSYPVSVRGEWSVQDRDFVGHGRKNWSRPWKLQDVKMANKQDGFTDFGYGATAIWDSIDKTLTATWRGCGGRLEADPPLVMGPRPLEDVKNPEVYIERTDGPMWQGLEQTCLQAGVLVDVQLIFPGEVDRINGKPLMRPVLLVDVSDRR